MGFENKQKIKNWIAYIFSGMIIGGGIGTAGYFIYKSINNNADTTITFVKPNEGHGNEQKLIIQEMGKLELVESSVFKKDTSDFQKFPHNLLYDFPGGNGKDNGLTILSNLLKTRLGFGPEINKLKKIYLQGGINFASDANGVYYGQTNEMFINTENIYRTFVTMGWIDANGNILSSTQFPGVNGIDVMAEYIFQIITHEYNHHIANVYLNSDYSRDNIQPTILAKRSSLNGGYWNSEWDSTFLNKFKQILGYNDTSKTNFPPYVSYKQNGQTVYPLSNIYSLKDLWDKTNEIGNMADYSALDRNNFYTFGQNSRVLRDWSPLPITKEDLVYFWNADELFVRKLQQATMTFPRNQGTMDQSGIIWQPRGQWGYYSPFLDDTLKYTDNIAPFTQNNFFKDYLFNFDGNSNSTNATAIYDALNDETGYNDKDEISVMWWKNDLQIDSQGSLGIPSGNQLKSATSPNKTNLIKFGGYLNNTIYKYIGYEEHNKFVSYPITINNFTLAPKYNLTSVDKRDLNATKNNFFYTTDDFIDVTKIKDKNLYFSTDENGTNKFKLTTANLKASTDTQYFKNTSFLANVAHPKIVPLIKNINGKTVSENNVQIEVL